MTTRACRNCEAPLTGPYCAACGQKALHDQDRRVVTLLLGFFTELTSLDGRFWRSLLALVIRPGVMSRAWIDGRRLQYISPLTLFLIANAVYFLVPSLSDFDLTLVDQTHQVHSRWTRTLLDALLAARGETLAQFAGAYAIASGNVGKLLLIVHVPFMALALALLRRDRTIWFAEHVIVALHLFTFVLLFMQVQPLFGVLPDAVAIALLPTLLIGYAVMSLRRAYRAGWGWSALAAVLTLAMLFAAHLCVYRTLQFLIALAIA